MDRISLASFLMILAGCTSADAPQRATVKAHVLQIVSAKDPPTMYSACPEPNCLRIPIDEFDCSKVDSPVDAVVLSGHSVPPVYLHESPARLASAIACLKPGLLVLDTCYGMSSPLLEQIADTGARPLVVGATRKLPPNGLVYDDGFFQSNPPEQRATHVHSRSKVPLVRLYLRSDTVATARAEVSTWSREQLTRSLRRTHPNLVRVPLPNSKPDAEMLLLVQPERFRP